MLVVEPEYELILVGLGLLDSDRMICPDRL